MHGALTCRLQIPAHCPRQSCTQSQSHSLCASQSHWSLLPRRQVGVSPDKKQQHTKMLPRLRWGHCPMTHVHKDECFNERGKLCTEFPRLSCNQKVANKGIPTQNTQKIRQFLKKQVLEKCPGMEQESQLIRKAQRPGNELLAHLASKCHLADTLRE